MESALDDEPSDGENISPALEPESPRRAEGRRLSQIRSVRDIDDGAAVPRFELAPP